MAMERPKREGSARVIGLTGDYAVEFRFLVVTIDARRRKRHAPFRLARLVRRIAQLRSRRLTRDLGPGSPVPEPHHRGEEIVSSQRYEKTHAAQQERPRAHHAGYLASRERRG